MYEKCYIKVEIQELLLYYVADFSEENVYDFEWPRLGLDTSMFPILAFLEEDGVLDKCWL